MAPIRVVLGAMPSLLGDIVRETLAGHPDVEVLADVVTPGEIVSAVQRTRANVAVVGISPADSCGLSGLIRELLAEHPRLTIVALASDGRNGCVYQLEPHAVAIADISPRALLQAIRGTPAMGVHPRFHPFSAD